MNSIYNETWIQVLSQQLLINYTENLVIIFGDFVLNILWYSERRTLKNFDNNYALGFL